MAEVAGAAPLTLETLQRKTRVQGVVKRIELYGAFIDIGVGVDAIIHISSLSNERVNRVSDILKVGDEVTVWVEKVDPEQKQIIVTMLQPLAVEWSDLEEGQVYTGKVTRLESFGAFIDIGAEKEGLAHISELSHDYVKHPSQALKVGDEVQVKILSFSKRKRRINLSVKALLAPPRAQVEQYIEALDESNWEDEDEDIPTAMEIALREAMGSDYRGGRGGKQRRQSKKSRAVQRDIINRTLQMSRDK